jgi:hypothetical protein
MSRTRIGCFLVISLALVRTGAAQEQNRASREQQLANAESKWLANKANAYEFRFEYACNGTIPPSPPGLQPWVFRVKGRESTLTADVTATVRAKLEQYETVEKQFAFIRTILESRPYRVTVTYDQGRGYPTRVCVDPTPVTDDEFGFIIVDWRALAVPHPGKPFWFTLAAWRDDGSDTALVRLHLDGQITLRRLGDALDAWTDLLREVSSDVAGTEGRDAFRFIVTEAKAGRFDLAVRPQPARPDVSATIGPRIAKTLTAGLQALEREPKRLSISAILRSSKSAS